MGRVSSKECLVFFIRQRKAFHKIVLRGIRNFLLGGALGLLWNATKQRSFEESQANFLLYSQPNDVFKSKFMYYLCQYFMDVSVVRFKIGLRVQTWDLCWILPSLCSVDFSCVNRSTSQLLLRELLLKINWWVFEKQFLCLLLYGVLSLIT